MALYNHLINQLHGNQTDNKLNFCRYWFSIPNYFTFQTNKGVLDMALLFHANSGNIKICYIHGPYLITLIEGISDDKFLAECIDQLAADFKNKESWLHKDTFPVFDLTI